MSQNKANVPLKIAIIGANGIGRVHARIFHSLGAKIEAITCSTLKSVSQAAKFLLDDYGIRTKTFSSIDSAIAEPIDAISICTPPHLHYDYILAAFDRKLPVFCEKPLFWDSSCNVHNVKSKLSILKNHRHRQLFMNTNNTVLFQALSNSLPDPDNISDFSLLFYTQGRYNYEDIAIDLLPHGFSILTNYFGEQKIHSFDWEATQNNFRCNFVYNHCNVKFDFQEKPNGSKRLSFKCNDNHFERIQEGKAQSYKVYMQEVKTGNRFYSDDPFKVYIEKFIQYCLNETLNIPDEFNDASINLRLMAYCLNKVNSKN